VIDWRPQKLDLLVLLKRCSRCIVIPSSTNIAGDGDDILSVLREKVDVPQPSNG